MPTTPFLLSSYTASSNVSTISISNISQSYTDLWLTVSSRDNGTSEWGFPSFQINGITTSTYNNNSLRGYVGGLDGGNQANMPYFVGAYGTANGSEANSFGAAYIYIPNYANASTYKNIRWSGYNNNNNATSYNIDAMYYWANIGAVTSLLFTPVNGGTLFYQYTQINVYGI